jgi:hypothetical protein
MRKSDAQLLSEVQALADAMRAHPGWCPPVETFKAIVSVPGEDRTDERIIRWMIEGPPPVPLALAPISPATH